MAGHGKALGIIESRNLLPLIEAANAMKKAADVTVHVVRPLGGGILVGLISGDLGAVRVAIETADAGSPSGETQLRTAAFPHPTPEVWELLGQTADFSA